MALEFSEKMKRLHEERPSPREDDSLEKHCGNLPPVEEGDRKVSLIMELSGLVSLHADRISHLEDILEEKDRKIQQLEAGQAAPPPS